MPMDSKVCRTELERIRSEAGYAVFNAHAREMLRERLQVQDRPERVRLSKTKRMKLYIDRNSICHICESPILPKEKWHVEHINPNLTGDEFNAWANLGIAHPACNSSKGALSVAAQAKRYGKPMTELI